MKLTGQGVRYKNEPPPRLFPALWLLLILIPGILYADITSSAPKHSITVNDQSQAHYISLLYSESSSLQSEIAGLIAKSPDLKRFNITLSDISSLDTDAIVKKPELVIAVGQESIEVANRDFRNTGKLLIVSNPGEFRLAKNQEKRDAVLYMSQPFCRQVLFINLINSQWRSFSYLYSSNVPVDNTSLKQCAKKYNLSVNKVKVLDQELLTQYVQTALSNSDLILAIPDITIYNRKTAKNILLTSYRDRKPIIAFSRNFVKAGALASIHSNAKQIAQSARTIIEQFHSKGNKFKQSVYYPQSFNISINRQVFRALDLPIPDKGKIKQRIENSEANKSGGRL